MMTGLDNLGQCMSRKSSEGRLSTRFPRLYSWIVVAILVVILTSNYLDRTILALIIQPLRADLKISDTQVSLIGGLAFSVMYALAGIPVGRIADLWSRRNLIAIGVGLWSLMTAICGLTSSFWSLFAARMGFGIGEATMTPSSYSLVSDYFPRERLPRAMSIFALGIPIGQGLALAFGGWLIHTLTTVAPHVSLPFTGSVKPWQMVFLVIGLPGILLVLPALAIREPVRQGLRREDVHGSPTFGDVVRFLSSHIQVYGSLFCGVALQTWFSLGAAYWIPTFMVREHNYSIQEIGLVLGICTVIFGVAGVLTAGWLSAKFIQYGRRDGPILVGMYYSAGLMACGIIGCLAPSSLVSIVFIGALPFFQNTWTPSGCPAALQMITPNRMRGQISAVYQLVAVVVGGSLGATSMGVVTDYIFHRDSAVGLSIALVGAITLPLSILVLHVGRKPFWRAIEDEDQSRN
jgi:MFS family permease